LWNLKTSPRPSFIGLRSSLIRGLGPHTEKSLDGVVDCVDSQFAPLLGIWGVLRALESYAERLGRIRDRGVAKRPTYRATLGQLDSLRTTVLPAAQDVTTLGEVATMLGEDRSIHWFSANSGNFHLIEHEPDLTLLDWLRDRVEGTGEAVRKHSHGLATAFESYSETLVAASNLRLQRWVLVLTAVVVLLTAITVWATIDDRGHTASTTTAGRSQEALSRVGHAVP
jgi:hypothetical protein